MTVLCLRRLYRSLRRGDFLPAKNCGLRKGIRPRGRREGKGSQRQGFSSGREMLRWGKAGDLSCKERKRGTVIKALSSGSLFIGVFFRRILFLRTSLVPEEEIEEGIRMLHGKRIGHFLEFLILFHKAFISFPVLKIHLQGLS